MREFRTCDVFEYLEEIFPFAQGLWDSELIPLEALPPHMREEVRGLVEDVKGHTLDRQGERHH